MSDYLIYYAESNIVCVVIFGIMLVHDIFKIDRQEKQIKFDRALVAFMLYFISDTLWAAVIDGSIPKTAVSVIAVNLSNYLLMAISTCAWLHYVMAVEQVPNRNKNLNRFAILFPFIVSTVVLIALSVFVPSALIDYETLEVKPVYNVFLSIVPIIYIIAVIFYSVRKARSEKNAIERKKHIYIGLFPLIVVIGGLIQIVFLPNTPIFCFCCTILMLIFYIKAMEMFISLDPLTGLNNRGQLHRFMSQESTAKSEGKRTFIMMIDVNDFKRVNDTFGHAEGDYVLTMIADSLKATQKALIASAFIGRYGGDEFVLIASVTDEKEVKAIASAIREEIDRRCKAHNESYVVTVGIGYDELLGDDDTFQKCMQRADHKLYLDKAYGKLHGHGTMIS